MELEEPRAYLVPMCGKFTQMMGWENLVRLSDLLGKPEGEGGDGGDERVETVTPMRFANVVTLNEQGERVSVRMRWGLVPPWAEDHTFGTKLIHARAETIDEKKTFRDAFEHRRGILITKTFNEGEEISKSRTQQYILTPKDGKPVGIAVIWERWTAKDGSTLLTFAMVTTPPNEIIGTMTDRMPAELPEADCYLARRSEISSPHVKA